MSKQAIKRFGPHRMATKSDAHKLERKGMRSTRKGRGKRR